MKQHILLVCYYFPPTIDIGGRRWAKFAKYLALQGYEVHVLAAKWDTKGSAKWETDVISPNIHIHSQPRHMPEILEKYVPLTFLEKIWYKIVVAFLHLFTKGNPFDRGIFWEKTFIKNCQKIITAYNIRQVVVTGAPFHLLYYGSKLHRLLPNISLTLDYRDPWTDHAYFRASLPAGRLAHEERLEAQAIAGADLVITVAESMTTALQQRFGQGTDTRFATLPNGIDPDDYPAATRRTPDGLVKFVFTGTLYPKLNYVWQPLLLTLQTMRDQSPDTYERLQFDFYGAAPAEYQEMCETMGVKDRFTFHGDVPLKQVYQALNQADIAMLFLQEFLGFSRSTKFYEYLMMERKIAVFAPEDSETAQHVAAMGIGYAVSPNSIPAALTTMIKDTLAGHLEPNPSYDLSKSLLPNLTQQLCSILPS